MRIGLVGCVKDKRLPGAPAKDLYTSNLWKGRRRYAERFHPCDDWYVLSALHGLVAKDRWLDWYDFTLVGKSTKAKASWARTVLGQLDTLGLPYEKTVFEIHAGAAYRDFGLVAGLASRGAEVDYPIPAGFGSFKQVSFYKERVGVSD